MSVWGPLFCGFLLRSPSSLLFESAPIRVNKVLGYAIGVFGCIVHLTGPVLSHHVPVVGTGSNVSDDPIHSVSVVVVSLMLAGLFIRVGLFLTGLLVSVGRFIIAVVH